MRPQYIEMSWKLVRTSLVVCQEFLTGAKRFLLTFLSQLLMLGNAVEAELAEDENNSEHRITEMPHGPNHDQKENYLLRDSLQLLWWEFSHLDHFLFIWMEEQIMKCLWGAPKSKAPKKKMILKAKLYSFRKAIVGISIISSTIFVRIFFLLRFFRFLLKFYFICHHNSPYPAGSEEWAGLDIN